MARYPNNVFGSIKGTRSDIKSPRAFEPLQRIRYGYKSGERLRVYAWRGTGRTRCITVINRGCDFFPYTTFDNISLDPKEEPFRLGLIGSGQRTPTLKRTSKQGRDPSD